MGETATPLPLRLLYLFKLGCARHRPERGKIRERSGVQARSLSREDDRSITGLGLSEDTLQLGEPVGSVRGVDVMSVRLPDLGRDELARLYDESLPALLDRGQSLREEPATVEPFRVVARANPSATVSRTLSGIGRRIGGAKSAARRVTMSPTIDASASAPTIWY